jgi:hypothetical protein
VAAGKVKFKRPEDGEKGNEPSDNDA